jgi:hypothetical protein
VYNRGTLTLLNCDVKNNWAYTTVDNGYGGGLYNADGKLTLDNCTVSSNLSGDRNEIARSYGGGLANYGGTVILKNSTFALNHSGNEGGGVFNYGKAYMTNCTFVANNADWGGGLFNDGDSSVVVGCTFVDDRAYDHGGGIFLERSLAMWDTIVAGNVGPGDSPPPSDVYGERISDQDGVGVVKIHSGGINNPEGGHNLIGATKGSYGWGTKDLLNVDPDLLKAKYGNALLANNGGPTETVAFAYNSPAINAGVEVGFYAGTITPLTTDQRGFKLDTPNPDIGAYQSQGS